MFKLSRLENSTQEIVFFVTLVSSLSLLIGGGFYLFLNDSTLTTFTGTIGKLFFAKLFDTIGFAAFLLGLGTLFIGKFLLPRSHNSKDILKLSPQLTILIIVQSLVVLMCASLLTVFEQYNQWQITQKLNYGAGGFLGWLLGGSLFKLFGLYGSIVFILTFSITVSIATGYMELLTTWYWLCEKSKTISLNLFSLTIHASLTIKEFVSNFISQTIRWYKVKTGVIPSIELEAEIINVHLESQTLPIEDQNNKIQTPIEKVKTRKARKRKPKKTIDLCSLENDNIVSSPEIHETNNNKSFHIEINKWTKRYIKPDNALLDKASQPKTSNKNEISKISNFLEDQLAAFQIKGKIVAIHEGVRLTMFEFQPEPGTKLSKISSLSSDLALVLGAESIRVLTPIPGKTTVGIEVPNKNPQCLSLGNLINCVINEKNKHPLPIALGKDVYNNTVTSDISEMPHLLVAGTTGSGKSVFVNNLITSLLYTRTPKELRFIMVDPKMIELSPYNGIPHLLKPVITDVTEAKEALKWAEAEMDKRYQQFADLGARNIASFNEKIKKSSKDSEQRAAKKEFDWPWQEMPYIVVIVDEMADLILTQGKDVEIPITRIAQKARAAGIHLILATQRPSAEIVTGLIKTNFPTRIAFKVSSAIDSRTILDSAGAEKLLGKGDMLFMPNGKTLERIQAAFLSEEEVKKIVKTISQ